MGEVHRAEGSAYARGGIGLVVVTSFGHWLSGFSDGEATFYLSAKTRIGGSGWHLAERFAIGLRADDGEILHEIRAYLRCGRVIPIRKYGGSNPQLRFVVDAHRDQVEHVVPHFDAHPLRSRKARDFEVWRRGVMMREEVIKRGPRGRGNTPQWTDHDVLRFVMLKQELEAQRRFR